MAPSSQKVEPPQYPGRFNLATWHEYLNESIVYEHTSWNHPAIEDLEPYVWQEATSAPSNLLRLAIASRSSNALVGTIGFHTVSPQNQTAELAYDLSPIVWGRGIATHLCKLMVHWAHAQANIIRVQATVLESNARSIKVLEAADLQREGLLRSYRMVRGTSGNFFMYSHVAVERVAT